MSMRQAAGLSYTQEQATFAEATAPRAPAERASVAKYGGNEKQSPALNG